MLQRLCFFINLSLHNSLSFSAGFLLTYIRKKSIIIELEIMVFLHGWNLVLGIISLFWLMYWIRHTQQFMSHYSLLPSSKVIHTDINLMMASREFVRLKVGSKKSNWKNKQCACGVHVQKRPRELCLKKECDQKNCQLENVDHDRILLLHYTIQVHTLLCKEYISLLW